MTDVMTKMDPYGFLTKVPVCACRYLTALKRVRRSNSKPCFFLKIMLSVFLALSMVALSACEVRKAPGDPDDTRHIEVISTVFASYDFARQIAGPYANVRMLVPPGAEIHSFEPTPQDMMDIAACDLLIYIGGESDGWVEALLASIDGTDIQTLRLMDCVELLDEDASVLAGRDLVEEGNREADEHNEYDEHVWTSIRNAKLITLAIAKSLKAMDPLHSQDYDASAAAYLEQLDGLDAGFKEVLGQARRSTLVFGDRFPFYYFTEEYGLHSYAAFPGCSTATEPSAQTVASLIDIVRAEGIPVVFYLELSDHRLADVIAQETEAQALLLHSCHNISRLDYENGETYVSLMEKNIENLRVALI